MKVDFKFELNEFEKSQWNEFWRNCRHSHPRQHLGFAEVERAKGRIPIFTTAKIDDNLVCAGLFSIRPLLFGKRFSLEAVALRGPIFDKPSYAQGFLSQLVSHFKALNVGSIRLSPYWTFPQANVVENVLSKLGFVPYRKDHGSKISTGLVDLRYSYDDILGKVAKNSRREIKRAERFGAVVKPAQSDDEAKVFFDSVNNMRKNRGFILLASDEFWATFRNVLKNKEIGILLNAYYDSTYLGGLWIVRSSDVAHYSHFVVESQRLQKQFSNLTVGPLIWWRGIEWAKENGCCWLDVVGYMDGLDKSHPKYRTYQHKRHFRPVPCQILSEHIYVCNPVTYTASKGCKILGRRLNELRNFQYQFRKRYRSFGKDGNSQSKLAIKTNQSGKNQCQNIQNHAKV